MDHFDRIIAKHRANGVIIDTNLFLLLVIGNYDTRRISTFKNTISYTVDDFGLVLRLIALFERRVTTPNILTEVDNLSRQIPEREHEGVSASFLNCAEAFSRFTPQVEML